MATTTANIGKVTSNTGLPFYGRFGLAVIDANKKKREICLKKNRNKSYPRAESPCDETPAPTGGVLTVLRGRPRTLTMSIFRDAINRFRLTEQRAQPSVDASKHYLAIELDDHSKAALKKNFDPNEKGFQVDPHHVTLKHDLSDEDLAWAQKHLGRNVNMRVTHHASRPGLHAVRVAPIGRHGKSLVQRAGKQHPHVTVAYDPTKAKPVQSNDLLAQTQGARLEKFLHIGGTVRLLPKPT